MKVIDRKTGKRMQGVDKETKKKLVKKDPIKRVVSIGGESMTSTEWCKKIGIKPSLIVDRVRRGGNYKNEIMKELTKFNERNKS